MTTHAESPSPSPSAAIEISPLGGDADARAFRALNEAWITTLFALEPDDERVLADPAARSSTAAARCSSPAMGTASSAAWP